MRVSTWSVAALAACLGATATGPAAAQSPPVNGIRPAEVRTHAIVGATVVAAPGRVLEDATVLIEDGVIVAVGSDLTIPDGARRWPAEGMTVYPGLIEPALLIDPAGDNGSAGAHWSKRVRPERFMAEDPGPKGSLRESLRKLGFTTAAVYPAKGIFRGSGVVIALADKDEHVLVYDDRAAMAMGFDYFSREDRTYPRSLMGAIAMIRQVLYDAQWHADCRRIWRERPQGNEPPERSDALEALELVTSGAQPVLFEVSDELNATRAARLAEDFELDLVLLGSGLEFRRLDEIAALQVPLIVPLNYPKAPSVSSLLEADDVSLRDMMTWEQAPTNARRLDEAGVTIALTTHRLKKRSELYPALVRAIEHGLDEDAALAALTTRPAQLLGLSEVLGTIEPGKAANLVVVEGSLFEKKPKIRDTWVNGRRHEISREDEIVFEGPGTLALSTGVEVPVKVNTKKKSLAIETPGEAPRNDEADADDDEADEARADQPEGRHGKGRHGTSRQKAKNVVFERDRLSFVLDQSALGEGAESGWTRLTGVLTGGRIVGTGVGPDGEAFTFTITPRETEDKDEEPEDPGVVDPATQVAAKEGDKAAGEDDEDDEEVAHDAPPEELVTPLGAYGLRETPRKQRVYITNATIWTCGPDGIIEDGAMYIEDGRIISVGSNGTVRVPLLPDVMTIDASGKHVTPGLLDCHSHTGISGGVNEMGQTNTAEVRIGDVINPDDVGWYRQLAGGLTAANQLHGSANPVGGQNSVVKLKWSGSAEDFSVDSAIPGIKFALGENVKRSPQRYPNTRMGVEAFIRDAFTAAQDYRDEWQRYQALDHRARRRTIPPRRDLELDTLVEILERERLIHCHSYRQDEILMLVRLADELGFTIGTFQHVLEGYKVAEALAAHGAGASSFSDWWAYKVEVMDAIPFNGALMHDVGVVVSFNSDSSELARRMNTEAAKAVRYGGVDPNEALQFVTLNAARQLRIDDRVGSLQSGKDADFAIWSESPLSTYARCEQTWIEGARYFDLETDRELRAEAAAERHRLVQKILAKSNGKPKGGPDTDRADGSGYEPPAQPADDDRPYSCCWSHQ